MKTLLILICLMPLSLWAHTLWKADVSLAVDGETSKVSNINFIENSISTVPLGNYNVFIMLKSRKAEKTLDVTYSVVEKTKKTVVNKGWDIIGATGSNDIFAKGEPNQPNSIITLNFKTK